MKLVSVIVPAYNIEKYIARCLDSILGQTYTNLEVIVVDDGSTDKTGEIIDEYTKKDSRIIAIHQVNAGLSGARNSALKIAQGDYIGYVDGDDYITPDMYSLMVNACEENNAEIALCTYAEVPDTIKENGTITTDERNIVIEDSNTEHVTPNSNNTVDITSRLASKFHILNQEDTIKVYLSDKENYHIYNSVWSKLFRRDIITGFNFPLGKNSEDITYTTRAFCNITKSVFIDCPLYNYVVDRADSLMNVKLADRRFNHEIPFWTEQAEILRSHAIQKNERNFSLLADMSEYYSYRRYLFYYEDFKDRGMKGDAKKLYEMMKSNEVHVKKIMNSDFGCRGDRARMNMFLAAPSVYYLFSKVYTKIVVPLKSHEK